MPVPDAGDSSPPTATAASMSSSPASAHQSSAAAPSATAAESGTVKTGRKWALVGVTALGVLWLLVLGTLVVTSSNPTIVNRVQILKADVVAEANLLPGSPPRLEILRVWKGPIVGPEVTLAGRLPVSIPPNPVLIPLSARSATVFEVTQGTFRNLPAGIDRDPPPNPADLDRLSEIRPAIYPATPDVLEQLQQLLPGRAPAEE